MHGAPECEPLSIPALLWCFQMVKHPKCFSTARLLAKQIQNTYARRHSNVPDQIIQFLKLTFYSCIYVPQRGILRLPYKSFISWLFICSVAINWICFVLVDVAQTRAEQERKSYGSIKMELAPLRPDEVKSSKWNQVGQSRFNIRMPTMLTGLSKLN